MRRSYLGWLLALCAAGLGLFIHFRTAGGCAGAKIDRPPDIVLIVWDTCRADRVTPGGYPLPTTPALARLAREGTYFRQCFTPSPWTPPAHASLFTGLLPRNHGLREGREDRVRAGIPLLAETLWGEGYETAGFFSNPHLSDVTGLDSGFETRVPCYEGESGKLPARVCADRVIDFLHWRRAHERPLFLFVNLMDTHIPYEWDEDAVAEVRGADILPAARSAWEAVTPVSVHGHLVGADVIDEDTILNLGAVYDGAVRTQDRATARIVAALRSLGMLGSTLLVVVSDHGEMLGEHGELDHVLSVHEPTLHVPLLIRWEGHFEGGGVVDAQVRLQDLYPTILQAAGASAPSGNGLDAVALTPGRIWSRPVIAEFGPYSVDVREAVSSNPRFSGREIPRLGRFDERLLAVRDEEANKYVLVRDRSGRMLRESLHDLNTDPGETRNLLDVENTTSRRELAARLRDLGLGGFKDGGSHAGGDPAAGTR